MRRLSAVAAAGAAFKDTWTLSDLDVAWLGLIADQHPAVYQLLTTAARLTHGKGMQSYLLHDGRAVARNAPRPQADRAASICTVTIRRPVPLSARRCSMPSLAPRNFRSEIAWRRHRTRGKGLELPTRYVRNNADYLLYYSHIGADFTVCIVAVPSPMKPGMVITWRKFYLGACRVTGPDWRPGRWSSSVSDPSRTNCQTGGPDLGNADS